MTRPTECAKSLRRDATSAEQALWVRLRRRTVEGFHFRRQVPLRGFIVDFVCFKGRLIVEVDGATHSTDKELVRDRLRDEALRVGGFDVLRVTNGDVYENLEGVLETVRLRLLESSRRVGRRLPP